eukprot:TRINITY_DN9276_c0_g2_i6.p2 TRINITY_DN9276_c0_g2~~TRINITY_DN9276_c0_g2_i6.p2  ORF type:complete len:210 (+),score=-17.52 TRINITY_DN9276_c0_g2_i6:254-883(+)
MYINIFQRSNTIYLLYLPRNYMVYQVPPTNSPVENLLICSLANVNSKIGEILSLICSICTGFIANTYVNIQSRMQHNYMTKIVCLMTKYKSTNSTLDKKKQNMLDKTKFSTFQFLYYIQYLCMSILTHNNIYNSKKSRIQKQNCGYFIYTQPRVRKKNKVAAQFCKLTFSSSIVSNLNNLQFFFLHEGLTLFKIEFKQCSFINLDNFFC